MTIDWNSFTPVSAAVGGLLIGVAAAILVLLQGRIAGISGIVGGLLAPRATGRYRLAYRLHRRPGAGSRVVPSRRGPAGDSGRGRMGTLIGAGLLVGFGTRLGSGCTSGHGVCGLSRLSPRSLAATLGFMGAGFATVFVVRHLLA